MYKLSCTIETAMLMVFGLAIAFGAFISMLAFSHWLMPHVAFIAVSPKLIADVFIVATVTGIIGIGLSFFNENVLARRHAQGCASGERAS